MAAPVRFYCTYCGGQHAPDIGTQIDARYATGNCGGTRRPLVRSEEEALRLARSGGKLRDKGVPLGGGQSRPEVPVADAARTRAIQEGRA